MAATIAQYNWNIVESGVKHHNPPPPPQSSNEMHRFQNNFFFKSWCTYMYEAIFSLVDIENKLEIHFQTCIFSSHTLSVRLKLGYQKHLYYLEISTRID
jgi:hypothetical protein